MSSFYAELHLEGFTFPVVRCSYSFHQPTDERGRPTSKVRHGPLRLLLDVPETDMLLDWAAAPFKPLAGQVVFYSDAQTRLPRESISFAAGQCVDYGETFDDGTGGGGAGAYVCALAITAPAFELHVGGGPATAAPPAAVAAALARLSPAEVPTPGLVSTPGLGAALSAALLADLERAVGSSVDVRTHIVTWVAGGLSEKKLISTLRGAVDKRLVFGRLQDADKGIYEQRVVVDDYGNIPGVDKKDYVENSLPAVVIQAIKFGVSNPDFDLPASNSATFTREAKLVEIKPGEKLYRVTNDPVSSPFAMTGGYWTRTPPNALSEVIGGTAVMPEWNNFQRVYEFTAPSYEDPVKQEPKFYAWEGPTAAQPVSGKYPDKEKNGYCLPGGDPQIFITNNLSRDPKFKASIQDISSTHKKW